MTANMPCMAMDYREALAWRMHELSRDAFQCLEASSFASAFTLTRAALETAAALWYLESKITSVIDTGAVGDINDHLMRLSLGTKEYADFPEPINVLTFVDGVGKKISGFRLQAWPGYAANYDKS